VKVEEWARISRKGAGEVKVLIRDDLLLWPYGAVKERRGKERRGGRKEKVKSPQKAAAGGWGAQFFLFLAIILYKNFSGMMA
jgi:hypothetical protein